MKEQDNVFPHPVTYQSPKTLWARHPTNLQYLQVTHTKSNIFKQKGWDSQTTTHQFELKQQQHHYAHKHMAAT